MFQVNLQLDIDETLTSCYLLFPVIRRGVHIFYHIGNINTERQAT